MNIEYTPRFLEDYVMRELRTNPDDSALAIAGRFIRDHAENFQKYCEGLKDVIHEGHGAEIEALQSSSNLTHLKENFLDALHHYGILGDDAKSMEIAQRIMATKIEFTFGAGAVAPQDEDRVQCDLMQNYKFVKEFPELNIQYRKMLEQTVFHELAHKLAHYLGIRDSLMGGDGREPVNESYACGVEGLVCSFLGEKNVYEDYYELKQAEIQSLGANRPWVSEVLYTINQEIQMLGKEQSDRLHIPRDRAGWTVQLYNDYHLSPQKIERYANPLSVDEIRKLVKPGEQK